MTMRPSTVRQRPVPVPAGTCPECTRDYEEHNDVVFCAHGDCGARFCTGCAGARDEKTGEYICEACDNARDDEDDDASVLSICCDRCGRQMLCEGRAQDTLMGYCESGRADCPCVHPPGTDPCLDFNLCGRCAEYNDDEGVVWCIDCLEA